MKRMNETILFALMLLFLLASGGSAEPISKAYPFSMEYNPDRTLLNTIRTPSGYERFPTKKMNMFMAWITNLPLKPKDFPVVKWDTQKLMSADSTCGVIDIGVTSMNQKDADMPIHLVLEFLRAANQLEQYPILVSDGDTVKYENWLNGKYTKDARGNLIYKKGDARQSTEKEYYRYLEFVMSRIDSRTLLHNLIPIEAKDVAPGCLYVQFSPEDADSIGHTSIIFDVAVGKTDESNLLLLAGWGGIPAHNLYIARPLPVSSAIWFTVDELKEHLAEYGKGQFYKLKFF